MFNTSNSDDDFAGFTTAPSYTDLHVIFLNESNDTEFFGF